MSTSTTAVIAALAAQRKRLIRHFVDASAFSPASAVSETSLPRAGFRLLAKLKAQGAILVAPDGRLYLDQARWASLTLARHARVRIVLAIAVAAALGLLAFTYFTSAA